jgi:hypothetical protein
MRLWETVGVRKVIPGLFNARSRGPETAFEEVWADEITVSAPNGRVDLEALKRPRLGGKEPSDDDYRL